LHHLEQVVIALQAAAARAAEREREAAAAAAVDALEMPTLVRPATAASMLEQRLTLGRKLRRQSGALSVGVASVSGSAAPTVPRRRHQSVVSLPPLARSSSGSVATGSNRRLMGGIGSSSRRGGDPAGSGSLAAAASHDASFSSGDKASTSTMLPSPSPRSASGAGHVPYRNSLLTSVLRDSLGGNCHTCFLATISPETAFLEETVSTCRFAVRCSQLTSDVAVNESMDTATQLAKACNERDALAAELADEQRRRSEAEAELSRLRLRLQELQYSENTVTAPLAASDTGPTVSEERIAELERLVAAWVTQLPGPEHSAASMQQTQLQLRDLSEAALVTRLLHDSLTAAVSAAAELSTERDGLAEQLSAAQASCSDAEARCHQLQLEVEEWQLRHIATWDKCFSRLDEATAPARAGGTVSASTARNAAVTVTVENKLEAAAGAPSNAPLHHPPAPASAPTAAKVPQQLLSADSSASLVSARGSVLAANGVQASHQSSGSGWPMPSSLASLTLGPASESSSPPSSSLATAALSRLMSANDRELLISGAYFVKHGRKGSPHLRFVWVDSRLRAIHWRGVSTGSGMGSGLYSAQARVAQATSMLANAFSGTLRRTDLEVTSDDSNHDGVGSEAAADTQGVLPVSEWIKVTPGRTSAVFARSVQVDGGRDEACFTLYARHRTLDLEIQWPGKDGSQVHVVLQEERTMRDRWVRALVWLLGQAQASGSA
jgi:hypothetical protein